MKLKHVLACTALVASASGGTAAAQPLPHGTLNQAERELHLVDPVRQSLTAAPRVCTDGLCLEVTLALADPDDPALCGSESTLEVEIGDPINICYRLINHTAHTLNRHTLVDSVVGTLFQEQLHPLPPHETYQFNRLIHASANANTTQGVFQSTWTAADVPLEYQHKPGNEAFVDITATGTQVTLSDGGAAAVEAPFPLTLYNQVDERICIGTGGGIYLDPAVCNFIPHVNNALPATNLAASAYLPYWDALWHHGQTYYDTIGTAPDRRFIVSWHNKVHRLYTPGTQTGITFQFVYHESDDSFHYIYQTTNFGGDVPASENDGGSATIGVQRNHASASQFSFNTQSVSPGLSIHWQKAAQNAFTVVAESDLAVGAPEIVVVPEPSSGLAISVEEGHSASEPVLIGNSGDRELRWQLTLPGSTAHFPGADRELLDQAATGVELAAPMPSAERIRQARGTESIPAYALRNGNPPSYISFDVLAPSTATLITSGHLNGFGADFVDDDFSRQFMITAWVPDPTLYELDTETGATLAIGSLGLTHLDRAGGATWDATERTFYVAIHNVLDAGTKIYTIDLETAQPTLVGLIPGRNVDDIAVDPTGLMYGLDRDNGVLLAIDKHSAEFQVIGSLGISMVFSQAMDFDDQTGILHLMAFDGALPRAYTIDTVTGAATLLGPTVGEMAGFSIAKAGVQCDTPETVAWLAVDADTGAVPADPDAQDTMTVTVDAAELAPGDYQATLCIFSNDPRQRRVVLPIHLVVTEYDDTLFRNGFE